MKRWWLSMLLVGTIAQAQDRVLDDFEDLSPWTVAATDDVRAKLRSVDGPRGKALCLDYDFGQVTGYVTARRALPLDYPARYEIAMNVRGDGPPNAFQFKLVDASGENVWWGQKTEYRFPREWQALKFRQRQIEFAWGPTADRTLRRSEAIEFVISAGSGGGKGSACFDRLTLRRLSDQPSPDEPREFGALTLRWPPGRGASRYDIQFSDDGQTWRTVRHVDGAAGDVQYHWLPDSEARQVRVLADTPPAVELHEAASANAFFALVAKQAPRGRYPRAYIGEQSYWTVFGVDGARAAALMTEDGVIEPVPGVGALEPFLLDGDRLVTWADARITQSLRDGDLPMPRAHWRAGNLALDIGAFGHGAPDAAQALARYTVRNLGPRTRRVTLALAWRPFQANPPTQFLAHPGGASGIRELAWDGHALSVNGATRLQPLTAPSRVRIAPAAAGPVTDWLTAPSMASGAQRVDDPAGFASAVLRYELTLRPGERREIAVAMPMTANVTSPPREVAHLEARVASQWRAKLDRVRITGPAAVDDVAKTLRTALGHILVNRSGPALQPGARAYARSWIRDGAMTSSALLRLGHDDVARDFLRWYAPFQFKNGKVPCCATARGADPVPENDSHGELAFALADYWRYTHDEATTRAIWPHVRAAIDYMETLRAGERTDANRALGTYGLMPPSISHEGYSDRPAYSYWDDFWAYTGYRSAAEVAQALKLPQDAARIGAQRDDFRADLLASIDTVTRRFKLDVLPGAADRGDVDPSSSTIALTPSGLLGVLPAALVRNTWAHYWREFEQRRADEAAGVRHGDGAYTPYEWRNVGALVRLGERGRALEAMRYFYRDRRPAGWRQWAEVVLRDAREPRFLGDMPHGWVASDHIRSVLDLFAYEHEGDGSLVLAAGVPMDWLRGPGLAIDGLRTPYGALRWKARAAANGRIDVAIDALRVMPPGGVVLRGPWPTTARVFVEGHLVGTPADSIMITRTPAHVRIEPY
ncbi:MAG: hypothetical protein ABI702_20360 [Burkholderiales bacterium]